MLNKLYSTVCVGFIQSAEGIYKTQTMLKVKTVNSNPILPQATVQFLNNFNWKALKMLGINFLKEKNCKYVEKYVYTQNFVFMYTHS